MRSRYSAHVCVDVDYLMASWDQDTRASIDRTQVQRWASESQWLALEVLNTWKGLAGDSEGWVTFKAFYRSSEAANGSTTEALEVHGEKAYFRRINGQWYFVDGEPLSAAQLKISRNDSCPCGSGKKYKKCCGA